MESSGHCAILGSGAWGTALAVHIADAAPVRLWARNGSQVRGYQRNRCNPEHLPGIVFPESLLPEQSLERALKGTRNILVATPSGGLRDTLRKAARFFSDETRIAWATKGLEPDTGLWMHEVVCEVVARADLALAVISGPTFAAEVAAGKPTAITVASNNPEFARDLAACLHHGALRAYTSDDLIGVEVGGAIKNVLAIAAGIADGLGLGANTRAALITRGLAEMRRLGEKLGGKPETFMGLAGLGDLVLTCTDDQSRNRRLGLALGRGQRVPDAMKQIGPVVEGVHTAKEAWRLAERHGVDMPIVEQVYRVLFERVTPQQAVGALLAREPKAEV